jgi:hypothetical protein
MSNADVGSMTLADSRFVAFSVPRAAIAALIPDVGDAIARPIPADNPAFRLLLGYLATANDVRGLITPELQRLAVTHVYDLLALALGATRDAIATARERGVRAAPGRGKRVRAAAPELARSQSGGRRRPSRRNPALRPHAV